jgi:hypothetical protein
MRNFVGKKRKKKKEKDERLLSIASDIEVLNTQVERDWRRLENVLKSRCLGDCFFFPLGHLAQ